MMEGKIVNDATCCSKSVCNRRGYIMIITSMSYIWTQNIGGYILKYNHMNKSRWKMITSNKEHENIARIDYVKIRTSVHTDKNWCLVE